MANDLFNKIMGKIPAPVKKSEEVKPFSDKKDSVSEREAAKPVPEDTEDTEHIARRQKAEKAVPEDTEDAEHSTSRQKAEKPVLEEIEDAERSARRQKAEKPVWEDLENIEDRTEKQEAGKVVADLTKNIEDITKRREATKVWQDTANDAERKAERSEPLPQESNASVIWKKMLNKVPEPLSEAPKDEKQKKFGRKQIQPQQMLDGGLQERVDTESSVHSNAEKIWIDLILDNTVSMTFYYKVLYDKLFLLMNGLYQKTKASGKNLQIYYGITYIRDREPEIEMTFSENGFTASVVHLLEKLKQVTFSGGSENGRENINGAIELSLRKLGRVADERSRCGIFLFTDSMPEKKDLCPCFEETANLCFVHCFVKDDMDYMPDFQVADPERESDFAFQRETRVKTLESLLNMNSADLQMQKWISQIWEGISTARG